MNILEMAMAAKMCGGGGSGGSDSGPIDPSRLPEGYPYKAMGVVTLFEEQDVAVVENNGVYIAEIPTTALADVAEGDVLQVLFDGALYNCNVFVYAPDPSYSMLAAGNIGLTGTDENTGEPFFFAIYPEGLMFGTTSSGDTHTIGISTPCEVSHPMSADFLPGVEARQASILLTTTSKPGYYSHRVSYQLTEDLTKGLQDGQTVKFKFTTVPSGTANGTGANARKSYVAHEPVTFSATGTVYRDRSDNPYISFSDVNIPVVCDSEGNVVYTLRSLSIYSSYVTAYFTNNGLGDYGYLQSNTLGIDIAIVNAKTVFALPSIRLWSSSEGSQLLFEITVNDDGTLTATEVTA